MIVGSNPTRPTTNPRNGITHWVESLRKKGWKKKGRGLLALLQAYVNWELQRHDQVVEVYCSVTANVVAGVVCELVLPYNRMTLLPVREDAALRSYDGLYTIFF